MMLGEKSDSADYWKKAGAEALAHDITGVIIMVRWIAEAHQSYFR